MQTLHEGQEFSGGVREISMARMLAFAGGPLANPGWPAKNLHTDQGKAAQAKLRAPIASGLQYESDIIRLLLRLFDDAWWSHGAIHVKYPRPVYADTRLSAHARVSATKPVDGGMLIELDVWCETTEKEVVIVGTASCVKST